MKYKKLTSLLAFSFLVVFCSSKPVASQLENRRDGNWWLTLPKSQRLYYAVGFFDGILLGHNFSYWGYVNDKDESACLQKSVESFQSYYNKYFKNVTSEQLADGLDSFYSDYRNRRIEIQNGVWLVVNGIGGTPQDKLEKMVDSFRKNAALYDRRPDFSTTSARR